MVLRIHPDLMRHLVELAKKNGLTKSMLVERSLVSFVNLTAGTPILDAMGRELTAEPVGDQLGTPASFDEVWQRAVGGGPRPQSHWDAIRRRAARHQGDDDQ
ncbi:hypothetical protein H8A95_04685 [Bradyrhizobium sp. Pear76]|uniref:hypothetical protein n=1 Tax=Bradyrhizobium oropedii TaxID=1571201 RepID=UPI001E579977|nr:hypothetical protein [Bradyrhizobium oropedii]MCC8961634.1 hypothetical protein [Bradyrhizobium oropedii]